MKRGTAYAKQVKRVYAEMKKRVRIPSIGEPADPLEQLVVSVLSEDTTLTNARRAWDDLRSAVVDLNEVRVSSPREVAEVISPYTPHAQACAMRLCSLLNAVFNRQCEVSLDSLRSLGKREAKRWLEGLDGIQPYNVASVLLWSLGGHAIPVNGPLLATLRREKLVNPDAAVGEVQSFLERHIPPSEAKTFCLVMADLASHPGVSRGRRRSSAKTSARVPKVREKSDGQPSTRGKQASENA